MAFREPQSPPMSPSSPASPLNQFLEDTEDVLDWVGEWEKKNLTMDQKHIEVLVSQWKLMRQGNKEHAHVISQMKKAMYELRTNGATLQDRLEAMERRLREDLSKEQAYRIDGLEKRLRDKLAQQDANREADMQDIRDFVRAKSDDRFDALQAQLAREKQLREMDFESLQKLLAKEAEVLREVKQHVGDESNARERYYQLLQDRVDRVERMIADTADKMAGLQAGVRSELGAERERREHDMRLLHGRLAAFQEKVEDEIRRDRGTDATLDKLRELLVGEQLAREKDMASIKDLFSQERVARELQGKSVFEMIKSEGDEREAALGEVRRDLAREAAMRERQGEALHSIEDRLGQYGLSVQERMDDVLGILMDAAGGMRRTWRGRGPSASQ